MKIKVDENISRAGAALLRRHGHDVATVREQRLGGAADEAVFEACVSEHRTLITLDHDFGQVLRFPPKGTAGIVILELGGSRASPALLEGRIRSFLALAEARPVEHELWVVEPARIRVRIDRAEGA